MVRAVTSGHRRVLVAEWRCCSAEDDVRPPHFRSDDTRAGFEAALGRDAAAPNLHLYLGVLLREEERDLRGALREFEAVLELDTHGYYQRVTWLFIGEVRAELEDLAGTTEALEVLARLGDHDSARRIAAVLQPLSRKYPQEAQRLLAARQRQGPGER